MEERCSQPLADMPPILHIVRHGQGYHEITENGHMLHDPELTPRGIEESKTLSLRFPYHDKVRAIPNWQDPSVS